MLKEARYEDYIVFLDDKNDYLGMPKMNFKFTLTPKDKEAIAQVMETQS